MIGFAFITVMLLTFLTEGFQEISQKLDLKHASISNLLSQLYQMTKANNQNAKDAIEENKAIFQEFENNRYPWWKFTLQTSYLLFTTYLWIQLIIKTVSLHRGPLPTLLGFIASQFLVDFVSGLVHWGCDTWGKFTTPIVGPTLIRTFRMHHVDPQDITIHSFIETNAASSYPMPFFIGACLMSSSGTFLSQTCNWMIIFAIVGGILTNECHKWAHMVHKKPHPIVQFLQRAGLIISHEKHHVHHQGDFDSAYCIINGWMNPILEYINFWRRLENLITKLTGAIPREDDLFWREVKEKTN